MRIGSHTLHQPLVLSPMVDVTDAAFRSLAKDWGADVTCSEMVSAVGLLRDSSKAWHHVTPWPGEAPYGVQFMCGEPEEMGQAVTRLATRVTPDFVDVNLGCPSPNILQMCAGGFLMRDPKKAGQVVAAAREAADEAGIKHISAKMRLGPSANKLTYLDVATECVAAGADWVTLHARTIEQGYSGSAAWEHIGKLVDAVDVPVIGNGDLRSPEDVVRMQQETHCEGYFIARAAMRDPTIFKRMRQGLEGQTELAEPSMTERLASLLCYLERAETIGMTRIAELRRQALRFVSGGAGAKKLRVAFQDAPDLETLRVRVVTEMSRLAQPEEHPRLG